MRCKKIRKYKMRNGTLSKKTEVIQNMFGLYDDRDKQREFESRGIGTNEKYNQHSM